MKSSWIKCLGIVFFIAVMMPLQAAGERPLLQTGKRTLYQRVLTTPSCRLAQSAGASTGKAQPAFTRFYVYQRRRQGNIEWLQVGPDSHGHTVGWIPGNCAVEWKMQMTLALTNPAGRDPLLFFRDRSTPERLLAQENPKAQLTPILNNLKNQGRDPAVLAREPEHLVDMEKNFYLLPVLEAEEIFTEQGFRVRLLNVASVSAKEAANPAPVSPQTQANTLKGFSAAVVFVIDSTISMGPYIQRTREAAQRIYQRLEREQLLDQVKFGLVAFRSSTQAAPRLEYVSRMFVDPNQVRGGENFLTKVAALRAASVSSPSYEEDSYAGVMHALDQINWNAFGGRYIVLITDAGAIEGDNELSSTGLSAQQVRLEAQHRGVAIYTLHLKTPSGRANHASAQKQYTNLSLNPFLQRPLYYSVYAGEVNNFGLMLDQLSDAITSQVKAAYRGDMAAGSALGADPSYRASRTANPANPAASLQEDAELLGHAMRLAWLGEKTGASAPPVFHAWISDRDFVQQQRPTTEVRVLLTKSQLSDLAQLVQQIANAANDGLISPADMFQRLRQVAATMGTDPNQLTAGNLNLSQMGLMAEYLDGLPYLSEVLSLDEDTWKGMEGIEQERFIRRLNTKLRYYRRYNADTDRWVSLAPGSDPRDHVYPVPLEALP